MNLDKLKNTIIAYKAMAESNDGIKVLEDLAYECFEDDDTYCDTNPQGSAYNAGKRYVMLHIRRQIATDINDIENLKEMERKKSNGRDNYD